MAPTVLRRASALAVVFASTASLILACSSYRDNGDSSTSDAGDATTETSADGTCSADLTSDPRHCGRCGHDCLGGGCVDGACQQVVLVTIDLIPNRCVAGDPAPHDCYETTLSGLASDDTHLYFGDRGTQNDSVTGGILRVDKHTTKPTAPEVVMLGEPIYRLALDGAFVYWSGGRVSRAPKTGGAIERLTGPDLSPLPWSIAVSSGDLFWTTTTSIDTRPIAAPPTTDGGFASAAPDAATNQPFDLAVDSANLFWSTTSGTDGGEVHIYDRATGVEPRIAVNQAYAVVAVDQAVLYWATADGKVRRATKSENWNVVILGTTDVAPTAIAVDRDYVYVATWGSCFSTACSINGTVFRMPKTPATTYYTGEVLAQGAYLPSALVVEDDAIYWTTWFLGAVLKLAK